MHPLLTSPVPIIGARIIRFCEDEVVVADTPTGRITAVMESNPDTEFSARDLVETGLTSRAASEILGRLFRQGKVELVGKRPRADGRLMSYYRWRQHETE